MIIVELIYALTAILLSLYGVNSLVLVVLYLLHRHKRPPTPTAPEQWPMVTVQLPLYNEVHLVERLLQAVDRLDYPRDRLEVQILDDSTDRTHHLAALAVTRLRRQGLQIVHLTRTERTDYKAGALAAGLTRARGELIAIFDADFCPAPDFLRQVVPYLADAQVGCVQASWGHLNRDYSLLTQAQALGMDGHFVVEQTARTRAGLFVNFNGTAGIWRRNCIEEAGGWQGDTLTEDLDLSYRAQLRGWRILYLPDITVPAELAAQISAYKRQQARWAQGSIQTALKLVKPLFRSDRPWYAMLLGLLHLTGYLVHPLMLLVILLTLPLRFYHSWVLDVAPWLVTTAIGPPLLYTMAQVARPNPQPSRLRALPVLMLLGTGVCLSNSWAVLKAVLGVRQGFQRTPKFALQRPRETWVSSAYALGQDPFAWGELALAVFSVALITLPTINWSFLPWLSLYAGGFGYVAIANLYQAHQRRRWLARRPRAAAGIGGHIRGEG